jgi:hypothetical protein
LILLFNLVVVDRETDCRIADIIAGLSKRFELDVKGYEVVILAAVIIDGDPADSTEIDFKIDAVGILMIFIFIRSVDIY